MSTAPVRGRVCPWMPWLGKGSRAVGPESISHPKAQALRADPRSRKGFVKDATMAKMSLGATREAWIQEPSRRRKHQEIRTPSNPVSQKKTSPSHTFAQAVSLSKLLFLLLSRRRTPTHPSRYSSNVPFAAFADLIMFPSHILFFRLSG